MTWEEFEQQTGWLRPTDWRERPDGPDQLDWVAAQIGVARGTLVAAMDVQP